jgi:hypothetical protein
VGPYDLVRRVLSGGRLAGVGYVTAAGGAREFRPAAAPRTARLVLGAVMLALVTALGVVVPAIVWLPRAIRYEVSPGALTVMLRAGWWRLGREVPRAAITAVRPVELGRGRRRVGSAIPGYCVGAFTFDDLGPVWLATSCGRRAVLVEAAGQARPTVISPADRDAFLAALVEGREATFSPPPGTPMAGWTAVKVLSFVPLLLLPLLVATFFVAPGRLRYAVEHGELAVRTLIATRRFPLAGASARRFTPGRILKVAGNGLPGYYTGLFRVEGASARVYATRLTDGVLIDGARRVFVTPDDAEGFLAELLRHGARVG